MKNGFTLKNSHLPLFEFRDIYLLVLLYKLAWWNYYKSFLIYDVKSGRSWLRYIQTPSELILENKWSSDINCICCKEKLYRTPKKNIFKRFFFKASMLHAKFCTIPCSRIQDKTTTRMLGKTEQQRPLLSYMQSNFIIFIYNSLYFV